MSGSPNCRKPEVESAPRFDVRRNILTERRAEERNLFAEKPELANALTAKLMTWLTSARNSYEIGDYPGYEKQGRFIREGR